MRDKDTELLEEAYLKTLKVVKENLATPQDASINALEKMGFRYTGGNDEEIYMVSRLGAGRSIHASVFTDGSVDGRDLKSYIADYLKEFPRSVYNRNHEDDEDKRSSEYDEPYWSEEEMG